MKELLEYWGIAAIVLGIVVFAIDYFFKINSNALLIIGLVMVLAGVGGQVWKMKRSI